MIKITPLTKTFSLLIILFYLVGCTNRVDTNDDVFVIDEITITNKSTVEYHIKVKNRYSKVKLYLSLTDSINKFEIGDTVYLKK